jgi:hypothetical protein
VNDWQKRVDQLKATIEGMPADKWTVLALADVAAGVLVASTGNPTDAKEISVALNIMDSIMAVPLFLTTMSLIRCM